MAAWLLFLVLIATSWNAISGAPSSSNRKAATCGYDSCPKGKPDVINVHIVPHTHDDVGWLKTVDQYYYGSSTNYQKAGVQYIISSVIKELKKDPARRFIYVEVAFFWQWWQEQDEATRDTVRQLVDEGRLEFVNGGWCMNDEAATHYNDIIDQMTWGLRFLNDTFGECGRPRVAWQIDPFGHSREQASLFALMGFDAVFFGRIDREDKARRLAEREMEMYWRSTNSLGDRGSIFSATLYNDYAPPPGFCFDVTCLDAPIIDDRKSPDYNVPQRMEVLLNYTRLQASKFATNNILFTMGEDFHYMTADMNFKNMDKMIRYANEMDNGVHMFYSTPSCYIKALNEAKNDNGRWPEKDKDDFFPYSSDPHAYWTGYFTSRPAYKGTVRSTNTFLQSCKQLHSLAGGNHLRNQSCIDSLRRNMAEAQHHDAVTGTEKDHVSSDYILRLYDSTVDCQQDVTESLDQLLRLGQGHLPTQRFCPLLNESRCDVSETSEQFIATVYNPRSQEVTIYIRLPVGDGSFVVLDPDGSELVVQLVPLASTTRSSIDPSSTTTTSATQELVFQASKLPPLGHKSFHVVRRSSLPPSNDPSRSVIHAPPTGERVTITNQKVSVDFGTDGLMESITVNGKAVPIAQNLLWYAGFNQGSSGSGVQDRPSGAYVFRPQGTDAMPISTRATLTVYKGLLVEEVRQQFADWASQTVRLYKGHSDVEIEWTVGPIPIDDGVGKEIVNRVSTGVSSQRVFYTDSNGRQTLRRERDFRSTWTLNVTESVSGNYYPINSHVYIVDQDTTSSPQVLVALVNDRAQGGSSIHDGEIELMVHRRLLYDDHFGVGEALNEVGEGPGLVVKGSHHLLVEPALNGRHPMSLIRPLAQMTFMKPWISFSSTNMSFTDYKRSFRTQKSGLKDALPAHIHILTLEPWTDGTHILRLEHAYDVDENPAQLVTFPLDDLLADYTIVSAEEAMLGANQWTSDSERLQWNANQLARRDRMHLDEQPENKESGERLYTTLSPMEIKTFIIRMTPKIAR